MNLKKKVNFLIQLTEYFLLNSRAVIEATSSCNLLWKRYLERFEHAMMDKRPYVSSSGIKKCSIKFVLFT
jgi:hypothetical protein